MDDDQLTSKEQLDVGMAVRVKLQGGQWKERSQ
jgi:hypothetical protein